MWKKQRYRKVPFVRLENTAYVLILLVFLFLGESPSPMFWFKTAVFFSVFMDFGTCWCVFYWSPVPQLLTFRLSSDSVSFRTVPCLCFKACAKNVDSKGDTQVSFLNITMFVLIAFSTLLLLVLSAFFNITIFVRSAIFNVTFLYLVRFSTLLFLYLVHVQRYCFCT